MNLSQGHSKTLHFISACAVQMETGFREEEGGEDEEEEEEERKKSRRARRKKRLWKPGPTTSTPHLPQVDKADDNPQEENPQPVEVKDALHHPLHVHRHQVDHVPCRAGLPGTTGQDQDLGRCEEEGHMRREKWGCALSAGPASVYHRSSEPVNFPKLISQGWA